jgi:hypothetical protein
MIGFKRIEPKMNPRWLNFLAIFIAMLCFGSFCAAQDKSPSPSPSPTPPIGESPDQVKVFTEEVVIPVSAYDDSGHLSVALAPDAIMVFEDDVRQTVRSIRRVPANALHRLGLFFSGERATPKPAWPCVIPSRRLGASDLSHSPVTTNFFA